MFKLSPSYKKEECKIFWHDPSSSSKIADQLFTSLPLDQNIPIIIVCIGTDRSTGDSLGPLIGTNLKEKDLPKNFHVYGTLEHPVHALNLEEKLAQIHHQHEKAYILAIDACLGKPQNVGSIYVKNGPLQPGAAVQKKLPAVGNIHITGIVNISGFMEFFVLQNTRLYLVMQLAKTITEGIYQTGLLYNQYQTKR